MLPIWEIHQWDPGNWSGAHRTNIVSRIFPPAPHWVELAWRSLLSDSLDTPNLFHNGRRAVHAKCFFCEATIISIHKSRNIGHCWVDRTRSGPLSSSAIYLTAKSSTILTSLPLTMSKPPSALTNSPSIYSRNPCTMTTTTYGIEHLTTFVPNLSTMAAHPRIVERILSSRLCTIFWPLAVTELE